MLHVFVILGMVQVLDKTVASNYCLNVGGNGKPLSTALSHACGTRHERSCVAWSEDHENGNLIL